MAAKSRILLLTRDLQLEEAFAAALEGDRHHVVRVHEPGVLKPLLVRGTSLVVVDPELPDSLLQEWATVLDEFPEIPVLVLDNGSSGRWNQWSQGGPREALLALPFSPETLRQRVEGLLAQGQFLQGSELVGHSKAMQELRGQILLIGSTPISTILITGESGVGKELVAQALHRYSTRRDRPFRPINCAAIPENLLESELFGHERGAFTDAKSQRQGIFEQADGGTVFLDEIGEMSLMAQVRLLRVLEQREVTRVGGSAAIPIDICVIAASNKDLQQAVARREFRLDLYHRLKVVELNIPPLRQRLDDLPLLIEHFVDHFVQAGKGRFEGFSPAAMELLLSYDWPGNVRELRNLIEHLVYLGPRRLVEPRDLLPQLEKPPVMERHLPVVTNKTPDQSERELIYFALLDLKREVAELRQLIEDRFLRPVSSSAAPIYQLEEHPLDIPGHHRTGPPSVVEPVRTLKELEQEAIEQALGRVSGNRKQAAQLLGISTRTLYRKLDEYGLK
jgi:DNA-binding NtrC family response regulator